MRAKLYTFFFILFLTTACFNLERIPFIEFRSGFEAPTLVRINEEIQFRPMESTSGAQRFSWNFGYQDASSEERNPVFSYDTSGLYRVELRTEILKSDGLQTDISQQFIRVIPPTEELASLNNVSFSTFGSLNSDERISSLLSLDDQRFLLAGIRDLNVLSLSVLNMSTDTLRSFEIRNLSSRELSLGDMIISSDTSLVVVGHTRFSPNDNDVFISKIRLNTEGVSTIWTTYAQDSPRNETYVGVQQLTNGNLVVVGNVEVNGRPSLLVDIFSSEGELLFTQSFGSSWRAVSISRDVDNSLLVAGQVLNNPALFRITVDENNNTASLGDVGTIETFSGLGRRVIQSTNLRYVLVGDMGSSGSDSTNAFVARFDAISEDVLPSQIDTILLYRESLRDIIETPEQNFLVIGTHYNPLSGRDILVAQVNGPSLQIERIHLLGNDSANAGSRIIRHEASGFLITGFVENANSLGKRSDGFWANLSTDFFQ